MDSLPSSPTPPCPSRDDLTAYTHGRLAPEAMELIDSHVSHCEPCHTVVENLSGRPRTPAGADRTTVGGDGGPPAAPAPIDGPAAARPAGLWSGPVPPFVLGRYQVLEKIGRGGMGTVYRAVHRPLKKAFALKVLSPGSMDDPQALARFQREREAVGRLEHPNLVRATDAGEDEGVHYLVMELIEGTDFYHLVRRRGPLRVADACEAVRQAALGLDCAHRQSLVHRDVKPSNLLLGRDGTVKVVDLGLALLRQDGSRSGELTEDRQAMGTADFMAPEQWESSHGVDGRADVYSLGCTLYALLTGRPPFSGPDFGSALRKMAAHANRPVPPVHPAREDVPRALDQLIARLTAKRPGDRPAAAGEVARALQPFCAGADLAALLQPSADPVSSRLTLPDGPAATPPRAGENTSPWSRPTSAQTLDTPPRRRRVLPATAAAGGVLAALVLALVAWRAPTPARPTETGGAGPVPQGLAALPPAAPVAPAGWKFLLRERPIERLWLPVLGDGIDHDPGAEVLRVTCSNPALVKLGESASNDFRLEVGLAQKHWTGGVGVYFGGRPGLPPQLYEFQMLHFVPHTPPEPGVDFTLRRARGRVVERPGLGRPAFDYDELVAQKLPRPANSDYLLELRIKNGQLWSVRWGGTVCGRLVEQDPGKQAAGADGRGEFGLYCAGAATVTSARLREE